MAKKRIKRGMNLNRLHIGSYLKLCFIKSIPLMEFPSKPKKVLFSHAELVPHKSFISDKIHASSQYITPLPLPSAMSQCRGKFTVTSHKSEIQSIISI